MLDAMQRSFTTANCSSDDVVKSEHLQLGLTKVDQFISVSYKWNSNEEIACILTSVDSHPEWISKNVQTRPANGSLLLYHKKESNYKQDGYIWKKRKDGKLPREDHMRLKVKGIESIYANYVHSALVPTFHRRSYWLLSSPDVVLVHYLNVPSENDQQNERIMLSLRQYGSNLSRREILDQLQPMLCDGDERSSGESKHNINGTETDRQLNWLNSLIDESRKPKYPSTMSSIGQSSSSSGNCVTSMAAANFVLVSYDATPDSSKRPLLVSIDPSTNSIIPTNGSTVILATASSPLPMVTSPVISSQEQPLSNGDVTNGRVDVANGRCALNGDMTNGRAIPNGDVTKVNPRSNSCGSVSRKIVCGLALKRQPSAFSDGAQDVFLPEYGTPRYAPDDSAYSSYADCSNNNEEMKKLVTSCQSSAGTADPLLTSSALNGTTYNEDDAEVNHLELSREEINEILKVNLDTDTNMASSSAADFDSALLGRQESSFRFFNHYFNDSTDSFDAGIGAIDEHLHSDTRRSSDGGGDLQTNSMQISNTYQVDEPESVNSRRSSSTSGCSGRTRMGAVATITDFSPDWSYPEGGVKVLISGPWYSYHHKYKCKFDTVAVPADFVQSGVLRCHCPPHGPGTVSLCVLCDDQVISNSVLFVYYERKSTDQQEKQHDNRSALIGLNAEFWMSANDTQFANGLLERLYFLETHLSSSEQQNRTNFARANLFINTIPHTLDVGQLEPRLVALCEKMSSFEWIRSTNCATTMTSSVDDLLRHHCGLTLLHYCAALGYANLIVFLCKWQKERPSKFLQMELDPSTCDENGRTPLMWACCRGKIMASTLLSRWSRDSLFTSDKHHFELPLALAYRQGHLRLIKEVTEQFVMEANGDPTGRDLDTALWVLTGGLVERSQLFGRKAASIQSHQLRKQSSTESQNQGKTNRERAKRASVEGLEDLMRGAVDPCHSCKVTKQNRDESVHAVEEWLKQPLNVDIPMDIARSGPDSPGMAWESITDSLSEADDIPLATVGAEMACLAQEIIDALPDRIKAEMFSEEAEDSEDADHQIGVVDDNDSNSLKSFPTHLRINVEPQLSPLSPKLAPNNFAATPSSAPGDFFNFRYLECETPSSPTSSVWLQSPMNRTSADSVGAGNCLANFFDDPSSTSTAHSSSFHKQHGSCSSGRATDLGAFFNAARSRSPLECHFQDLTLSDREQRELYEAAKVIQNAFRQYKKRVQNQRQIEMERQAATVIQTYYRRYKQYCYFKKLHHAAALIQKHFRLYKASKRKSTSSGLDGTNLMSSRSFKSSKTDHNYDASSGFKNKNNNTSSCECSMNENGSSSSAAGCIRIEVTQEELRLWKQQLAAIRIQHAFRGHIKRQAAARTIQRFMRQSKQNDDLDYLITKGSNYGKHTRRDRTYNFATWLSKYALERLKK